MNNYFFKIAEAGKIGAGRDMMRRIAAASRFIADFEGSWFVVRVRNSLSEVRGRWNDGNPERMTAMDRYLFVCAAFEKGEQDLLSIVSSVVLDDMSIVAWLQKNSSTKINGRVTARTLAMLCDALDKLAEAYRCFDEGMRIERKK